MASISILFTNFTTGASSTLSVNVVSDVSSLTSSKLPSKSLSLKLAKLCTLSAKDSSIQRLSLSSSTSTVSIDRRELKAMASIASTRVGSLSATNKRWPRLKIGRALNLRTIFSSTKSLGIMSLSMVLKSNKGSPKDSDSSTAMA